MPKFGQKEEEQIYLIRNYLLASKWRSTNIACARHFSCGTWKLKSFRSANTIARRRKDCTHSPSPFTIANIVLTHSPSPFTMLLGLKDYNKKSFIQPMIHKLTQIYISESVKLWWSYVLRHTRCTTKIDVLRIIMHPRNFFESVRNY